MKASEMTNEELATAFDGIVASGLFRSTNGLFTEAAERLRNVTVRTDNSKVISELQEYLKASSIGAKAMREEIAILRNMITSLRAKLKVSEKHLVDIRRFAGRKTDRPHLALDAIHLVADNAVKDIRKGGANA